MATEEKEITFYADDRGVRITNTRLMVSDKMYAMANITSVKIEEIRPNYSGPILTGVVGSVFCVLGFTIRVWIDVTLGVLLLVAGIVWGMLLKRKYNLQISSASGESSALMDRDKAYVQKLVQAIHEAIIHRG
jgi:hypothetical protein